ncbi:MAG: 30S ribosomal protein S3 [Candidatus Nanoarchaeia archaeon]|nr:30S ribosomal protein S3 [Candidatus Nanoarchaeia archaeon]MDD5239666.1 30S ribosomal protein S3 [Candidatus Nanoarchaeia archaeon]
MVIERKFIKDKLREYSVKEYLAGFLDRVGFSHIDIQKTPVGFSILIYSSKPGLIVGRKGINIKEIQDTLQKEFKLESPVVEVQEVSNPNLDSKIVAEQIGNQLRKFGAARFKAIGHKAIEKMMQCGAVGCEIRIAGLVPSSRAKAWRFYAGYLPKCGDVAIRCVDKGYKVVQLKRGIIGVTVKILPPGIEMPDQIHIKELPKKTITAEELSKEEAKKEHEKLKKAIKPKEDAEEKKIEEAEKELPKAEKEEQKEIIAEEIAEAEEELEEEKEELAEAKTEEAAKELTEDEAGEEKES